MQINPIWLATESLQAIFAKLSASGFQAYGVGGCVRDTLLGNAVGDIDLCSDATPDQIYALFDDPAFKLVPTGIAHGTLSVIHNSLTVQITTMRDDIDTDGRHAQVQFGNDIIADAKRRDFTMNALYVDRTGRVFDPLGGMDDLLARRVRFIGDADQRIAEDYLRILRFFRFNALYAPPEQGLDADGLSACAKGQAGLTRLSKERISSEICKLLGAHNPAPAIAAMAQSGVLSRVLGPTDTSAIAPLVYLENGAITDWHSRLAGLRADHHNAGLRLSKRDLNRVQVIADYARNTMGLGEIAYRFDHTIARNIALLRAALIGTAPDSDYMAQIQAGQDAVFPLAAADLPDALSGAQIGAALKAAQQRWIDSNFTLNKQELINGIG